MVTGASRGVGKGAALGLGEAGDGLCDRAESVNVGNIPYGVGKAGIEKLVTDMAEELRPHNVASVSLWRGFTRTEFVLAQPASIRTSPGRSRNCL